MVEFIFAVYIARFGPDPFSELSFGGANFFRFPEILINIGRDIHDIINCVSRFMEYYILKTVELPAAIDCNINIGSVSFKACSFFFSQ